MSRDDKLKEITDLKVKLNNLTRDLLETEHFLGIINGIMYGIEEQYSEAKNVAEAKAKISLNIKLKTPSRNSGSDTKILPTETSDSFTTFELVLDKYKFLIPLIMDYQKLLAEEIKVQTEKYCKFFTLN